MTDSPSSFRHQVAEARRLWREHEQHLEALAREYEDVDDPEAVEQLRRTLIEEREQARVPLLLRGINVLVSPPTLLPWAQPERELTGEDQVMLYVLGWQLQVLDFALRFLEEDVPHAPRERQAGVAARAVLRAAHLYPRLEAMALQSPSSEAVREAVALNLSGWVGGDVSLNPEKHPHVRRLVAALDAEAASLGLRREDVLHDLLPAEALSSLLQEDAGESWNPRRIRDRVTGALSKRQQRPERGLRVPKAVIGLNDGSGGFAAEQEFRAEEEAAHARVDAGALIEQAHLSERERQVSDLDNQGYTGKEIGEILGIAEGTVKSFLSRARQKLDRAAGPH
jgi:DNA-directed RNA polymerase specialized sigma24 family protein